MSGLDDLIAGWGDGGSLFVVLGVALVLGLRHATDPDHLVAVSALVASERERPLRRAALLGISWGLGHAATVVGIGLPVVFLGSALPESLQRAAEILVGLVIMALAVRLLFRWRQGIFHVHTHSHDGVAHRHLHRHEHPGGAEHEHRHALSRSPVQAFAIGLVHGVGGSAAVGVLLLVSIADRMHATLALLAFGAGTTVSMAVASASLGCVLARGPLQRFRLLAPVAGFLGLAFGAWYAAAAALPLGL